MSPDPTADRPSPLVEFIRTNRANAAYALLALALGFLILAGTYATRDFKGGTPAAPPPPAAEPGEPPPPPPPTVEDPKKNEYRVAWLAGGFGFLVAGFAGTALLASIPRPTPAAQRTYARTLILAVGGLLGAGLVVAGGAYFYLWHESLVKWLDAGDPKEMRGVVIPLLMVVAGAGLVFAAVQPARAEERGNQLLRRLVYWTNFGLTVLLLLLALVIGNVVANQKVTGILDTTETGFYTLSDATKTTVARLPVTVTAHVIFPDAGMREVNDIRQLMYSAAEASGGKFVPKFVSPVTNKGDLQKLQEQYPKLEKTNFGVLLTVGDGAPGGRHEFIPPDKLFKQDMGPGGKMVEKFIGEGVLVQKLRVLADADAKTVVYFTQGSGELVFPGGAEAGFGKADRDMAQLKAHLDSTGLEVKPLEFKAGGPAAVPADADVVVVADPLTPLPDPAAKALKDYMGRPGPKKGKLVVLAEARAGAKDRKMAKTGLEGLLAEFNVKLGDRFVYSVPIPAYQLHPKEASVVFAAGRDGTGHPIAQPFARLQLLWNIPREVAPLSAAPGGPFQVTPLMTTLPARPTWLEDEVLDNPIQAFTDLVENDALRGRKQLARAGRTVAVAVSEGGAPNPMNPHAGGGPQTPRLAVFAAGEMFSNEAPRVRGGGTPPSYELMAATIDWLRDVPVVAPGVGEKDYVTYLFPRAETVNETRLIWLPIGLAMVVVAGLGAGVWVMRRK